MFSLNADQQSLRLAFAHYIVQNVDWLEGFYERQGCKNIRLQPKI